MWLEFVRALVAAGALLYVPGYLLLRVLRLGRTPALVCAPMASLCAYAALPIVYYALHVPCSAATVALPTVAIALLAYAVARGRGRQVAQSDELCLTPQPPVRLGRWAIGFNAGMLAAYALVGTAVCAMLFLGNLPNAGAFYPRFDNQTHLNLVQAFLDSGTWSSLHANVYLASAPNAAPVASTTGGFYPAAFHDLLALICSLAHTSAPVATNAVVALTCAFTFPTCMFLLIRVLAKENRAAVLAGSLCVCGSAVLPWAFAIHGPTWPDMLANMLVPAFAAFAMLAVEQRCYALHPALTAGACVCLLDGLALTHPNALFTIYVFLGAYGGHLLWHATHGRKRALVVTGYALALIAGWAALHFVPMFKATLEYKTSDYGSIKDALRTLITLSFGTARFQPVLLAGIVAGVMWCVRHRRLWLLFAPAFFAVCYVGARTNIEFITYWVGGFWYKNGYRFGTRFFTFALPVVAFGTASAVCALHGWLGQRNKRSISTHASLITAVVVALICAINYWPISADSERPGSTFETSFGRIRSTMHNNYALSSNQVYNADEAAFVDRVRSTVPADDLVLNFPNDGSVWSYGADGLNTYYRFITPYNLTDDATLIAASLNQIETNSAVRDAVRRTGARWLLLLDVGVTYENGDWLPQYKNHHQPNWAGVATINDQAPGFSTVLAQDDMRLYRIDAADE
ncbi:MAG: hypothetical protein Q4A01_05530 [Coriobacteriales bacterium]|nr:hypothetical protein [Coriobacteriales bacterium]